MAFCINVGFVGLKVQTNFSQDVLFISCNMFHNVTLRLHLIEHVSLGFNIYYQDF